MVFRGNGELIAWSAHFEEYSVDVIGSGTMRRAHTCLWVPYRQVLVHWPMFLPVVVCSRLPETLSEAQAVIEKVVVLL